ncbi:MAG: PIN domain-containing protein [Pseudomonadota bacterium]
MAKKTKHRPFKILIDTCVWLDLAKDYQQQPILTALEGLVQARDVELILSQIVVDEFARNKHRVIETSSRSLSTTLKRAKEAIARFGDPRKRELVLGQLNDVDHRVPTLGSAAVFTVSQIEAIFATSTILPVTDAVKLRAVQRAMDKRAPFHRQRNSIDDAILIETYADVVGAKSVPGTRFAFVTHNTKDFSHPSANTKSPHPDIASCFSRVRSLYFTTLGDALRRVKPEQFADLMIEQEWIDEPRRLPELVDAVDELVTMIWYNRHQVRRQMIERGDIELVDRETFPIRDHLHRPIQRDIWEGALKAAEAVERDSGIENLGPWDDFEWGMLNGKLSALRWVLGDEWDMLDT